MKKTIKPSLFKKLVGASKKHAPVILSVGAVVGLATTVYFTVKETPHITKIRDERKFKKESGEQLENPIKDYLPHVWKPALGATLTIGCILMSNHIYLKRSVAAIASLKLAEETLDLYKDRVVEVVGKKKSEEIQEAVAEERLKRKPLANEPIIITNKGDTLIYDVESGRYFKSDIEALRKAENMFNEKMFKNGYDYASLNDFYELIGLEDIRIGDEIGWNVIRRMDLRFTAKLTEDGQPCIVMDHKHPPILEYYNLM